MSERAAGDRGKKAAALTGTLCAVLLLTTACSSGPGVPQVNLGGWAHSRTTRAARQQVTARIAAAINALRAAHLSVSAETVEDHCARWTQIQGNGAITQWGVLCMREEEVFGGFSTDPAAQLTAIRHSLEYHGWGDWGQLRTTAQCGNYARGNASQMQGDFSRAKLPLAASPGVNTIEAKVIVGPSSGHTARGNINYLLGCVECGPDARPGDSYQGGIPPFYYVEHTCPRSSAIENRIAGQAGMWYIDLQDSGYVYATASGTSPPRQSQG